MIDLRWFLSHCERVMMCWLDKEMAKLRNFPLLKNGLVLVLCVSAVSCGLFPEKVPLKARHVMYEWHDHGGPGEVNVRINLTTQIAQVRRGQRMIGWCYVATGKEGKGTPAGRYRIMEKMVEKHSNKYGWVENELGEVTNGDATPAVKLKPGETYFPAPMPYWQRLTSYGIGMHVGIIPEPGKPASHGCIRMPQEFCPLFFEVTQVGTPVQIVYGPQDPVMVWN